MSAKKGKVRLPGKNTHIANATKYQIFARVDDNQQQIKSTETKLEAELGVKMITGTVDVAGNSKLKYENKTEYFEKKLRETCGFTIIGPGQFDHFPSNNPHVSVFYKKGSELGQVMCHSKRIIADNSIIVTPT
ncbi:Hypothetical predicted protein, partial [Paramuricea clavata]